MKRILLVAALVCALMLLFGSAALAAATDPIVCSMEVSPTNLAEPGEVSVTITISNSGDTDLTDPLTLYNPASEIVTDFGDKGSATLKAGEVKTWTGKWDVNQKTLDNGQIVFFVKYVLYDDSGARETKSQPIRGKLNATESKTDLEVKRTISPGTAREGQTVTVKYDIVNIGTVSLKNVTLQENKDINAKVVKVADELKAGETAQVKLPVKMGKKDLTSSATITYTTGDSKDKQVKTVQEQKITYGEAAMTAKLTSSAKGAAINGTVTLTLELKNNGTIHYTDLRVTDDKLGDVFTNQELDSGATLKLDKEITLTETTDYQFHITAVDNTGTEVSLDSDPLTITAVDPNKMVHLNVTAAADRTEVYTQPGIVRFTLTVENDSQVEAKDVAIYHGTTKIYTFPTIPVGESRNLTRDAALSMAGKYRFTAVTVDAAGISSTFDSNEIQIAFSIPTPAPATATPPLEPTPEPTYAMITVPPISHPSVGTLPKMIRTIFYPLMIVSLILLVGALGLLVLATRKRIEQRRASDVALDHLDRAKRRDYAVPGEEDEAPKAEPNPEPRAPARPAPDAAPAGKSAAVTDDAELPHMKYVRNAYERSNGSKANPYGKKSLYDDDPLMGPSGYGAPAQEEEPYHTYGSDRDLPPVPAPDAGAKSRSAKARSAEPSPYAQRPQEGDARRRAPATRQPDYPPQDASSQTDYGYGQDYAQGDYADESYAGQVGYPDETYAGQNGYAEEPYTDATGYAEPAYGQEDAGAYPDDAAYSEQDGYVQDPLGYDSQTGYPDDGQGYAPDASQGDARYGSDPYGEPPESPDAGGASRRSGRSANRGR